MSETTMEKVISLAKRRGFVYPGSEIYGGLANSWDYGPLGVELKNNVKKAWWKSFVTSRLDVVGMDSAILMNPQVWEASGHLGGFSDPLMDCKKCKTRHRADKLIEEKLESLGREVSEAAGLDHPGLKAKIAELEIGCPDCGAQDFTDIREFNLMFKTFQGVNEDTAAVVYLRPETAQGIFCNFKNVVTTSRKRVPFGIAQVGKAFRNEITPGNFIFRTREFEQMELEYFCHPSDSLTQHQAWKDYCWAFLLKLGMQENLLRMRDHKADELSHYSKATADIEFQFPFGWGELWGIAHRGDFDLTQHASHSNKDLSYVDPISNEKFLPHVIEPSLGVDRVSLAFLLSAYHEETLADGDVRVVLRLSPQLAPIKVAILPLSKKLAEGAMRVYEKFAGHLATDFDESASIGKRYRRQDEVGTPYCLTYDFESETDHSVTVRERDSMSQERVKIEDLLGYFHQKGLF